MLIIWKFLSRNSEKIWNCWPNYGRTHNDREWVREKERHWCMLFTFTVNLCACKYWKHLLTIYCKISEFFSFFLFFSVGTLEWDWVKEKSKFTSQKHEFHSYVSQSTDVASNWRQTHPKKKTTYIQQNEKFNEDGFSTQPL